MRTILFDLFFAQPIGGSKFHGGGEYIKTIFEEIAVNLSKNEKLIVFYNYNEFLDDWVKKIIKENGIMTYNIKDLKDVEPLFVNEKVDVFYSGLPYKYYEINIPSNVVKIGTFHGLRDVEIPSDKYASLYSTGSKSIKFIIKYLLKDFWQKRNIHYYQKGLNSFDHIITVSLHSKYAIESICDNINDAKVKVFYAPSKSVAEEKKVSELVLDEITELGKYILVIGGNRWEKNSYRAILAIEDLFEKGKLDEYKVVIVGKIPDKVKKRLKKVENYIIYGYVEPVKLEYLYQNCDFFLFPTLNEGFGMPPLEAMRYGKTSIVSAVCSLPELCGDSVYYINPYDVNEIKNRILRATREKINSERVMNQFKKIHQKQLLDLKGVSNFITNIGSR